MGVAIAVQTLTAIAVTVALWRHAFVDRAMGWALRLGMAIAVAGASVGGLMTQPTRAQLESARVTHEMPRAGAHSVGGLDGGPGLPGTGWSTEHGDLRVPHFVGLHAVQVLPLLAVLLARRLPDAARVRAVVGAGVIYAALFLNLLGQPLLAPQGPVLGALAFLALGSAAFALGTWRTSATGLARHTAPEGA